MKTTFGFLFLCALSVSACGQYVAVGAGGAFNHGLSSSDVTTPGIITAEGGLPIISFLDGALHYSFARPQIQQDTRYAPQDLPTHTLTLDARVHSPEAKGFRVFGLAGVGLTHFSSPGTTAFGPSSSTHAVFDYGAGVERRIVGPFRVRAEVRDYFTSSLYAGTGTGSWNRIVFTGGLVFGKK